MKAANFKVPKVDKNNWARTIKNIVHHVKLVRVVRGVPLVYVVRQHIKVAHISPGYSAYLDSDEEIIARTPIVDTSVDSGVPR